MSDRLFALLCIVVGVLALAAMGGLAVYLNAKEVEPPIQATELDRAQALVRGDDSTALKPLTGLNYQGVKVTQRCRTVTRGADGTVGSWAVTVCWIRKA